MKCPIVPKIYMDKEKGATKLLLSLRRLKIPVIKHNWTIGKILFALKLLMYFLLFFSFNV